ncbi:MAG: efflux RND transporter periplasmic adaptor subunit [Dysgonamonadaceae bacterium]|jgi:HlyD family secretion protein|nr:efflux RND transporter periplasmic adaptor subunit [Dysgonamonadaceae bacterium]
MENNKVKQISSKNRWLASGMLIAFLILIASTGYFILKPGDEIIQGQVETTEVRISGKIPGRILEYCVKEGQRVKQGDTLVLLDSPEIYAKLLQAQAAEEAALAQNRKALEGTREELINSACQMWQKAKAGAEIAEISYKRIQNLFDKGVMSAQKRDEAEANYKAMTATEKAAYLQYEMAVNGAGKEDKSAAAALVDRAKGAVAEVESYMKETALLSPIDGEVSEIFPERGELVGTGAPIMNIQDRNDAWVLFNVREDLLKDLKPDSEISGFIPALDKKIDLKIIHMKDLGSYAVWKSTKTTGQYDLKTFEIKAVPSETVPGLYPGMSVIIKK